jgi:carbon starvation protein
VNSLVYMLLAAAGYLLAYRLYGRFLGRRIFELSNRNRMPAHRFRDDVDYIPSKRHIVLGHHFTTIAGLGPIVGPAIGIIWGWLPATLWVIFGSIFLGAVHDFSAMVMSARHRGRTLGDLTGDLLNPTTRHAFQLIIQFLLWIVVAIFAMIMGILFTMYPQSVLPIWLQIPIAVWLGRRLYRGENDTLQSLVALLLMYLSIGLGLYFPITVPAIAGSPIVTWTLILLAYAFIASTLPVHVLLQPRDYINSNQLLIAMALLVLGVCVAHPPLTAPALNPAAFAPGTDIPPLFPLLFITIACGAISGFHSLAASGTVVKQIDKEEDMLAIGYGGMLIEGLLAALALAAIAGGMGMGLVKGEVLYTGAEAFRVHYASWASAQGMAAMIEAFVVGAANLLGALGIPPELGKSLIAVFIVSFAGTTLDSATRIQRLSLQEIFRNREGVVMRPLHNNYAATLVVVVMAAALCFAQPGAKGALMLWPMFGALNQLLAALGLTVATVYLAKKGKNILITFLPMLFMLVMTTWAMAINLRDFYARGNMLLFSLSVVILLLTLWLLIGAACSLRGGQRTHLNEDLAPEPGE